MLHGQRAARRTLRVARCMLYVARCALHVACCTLRAECDTLRVAPVGRRMLHGRRLPVGGASRLGTTSPGTDVAVSAQISASPGADVAGLG
jgi:hypothetical protein